MKIESDWQIVEPLLGVLIALFVAWIAYQQWKTAKDKLAVELFERRFASWRKLNEALDEFTSAIDEGRFGDDDEDVIFSEEGNALAGAERATLFLFGPDFRNKLDQVVQRAFAHKPRSLGGSYTEINHLRAELSSIAERYMMLGHIGRNKPSRIFGLKK